VVETTSNIKQKMNTDSSTTLGRFYQYHGQSAEESTMYQSTLGASKVVSSNASRQVSTKTSNRTSKELASSQKEGSLTSLRKSLATTLSNGETVQKSEATVVRNHHQSFVQKQTVRTSLVSYQNATRVVDKKNRYLSGGMRASVDHIQEETRDPSFNI
jgi:hypothetical protein